MNRSSELPATAGFRRGAPSLALRYAFTQLAALGISILCASGCNPGKPDAPAMHIELQLTPSPPMVGRGRVSLNIADATKASLTGAVVRVEGNMNHAGMKPTFADLREEASGHYSGELEFTMAGDWFLLVTVRTSKGETLEQKLDVPGVMSR